jgi:phosphoribosyl-AMP cyclohydrolase
MIKLDFAKQDGLVPAIVQDWKTGDVLMLGYMNEESFNLTLETGKVHYWSRSRNKLWLKGEQSGNFQIVKDVFVDCDNDTLLIKAEQIGNAACHEGYKSCFFRRISGDNLVVECERMFDPAKVYGSHTGHGDKK